MINMREYVAINPSIPAEILAFFANDESEGVRKSVAGNSNTPVEVLELLAKDESEQVRKCLVKNPNTPATALTLLANDTNITGDHYVILLLSHPKLNDDDFLRILEKFYEDEEYQDYYDEFFWTLHDILFRLEEETVRSHRAVLLKKASFYNESLDVLDPNASSEKLERLAYHENWYIRDGVAAHSNTPAETFNLLSDEEKLSISLACNPNVPIETFIKVITNFEIDFDCLTLREELSIDMLKELMIHPSSIIRSYVATHPNTSCEMLSFLANDADEWVRYSVAGNPNTSPDTLLKLAASTDSKIIIEVVQNKNTPLEALLKLAKDRDGRVKCWIAENVNSSQVILSFLANSANSCVRSAVAENQNTPPQILNILANDKDEEVRIHVAENPNTPQKTLMRLANISFE